MSLPKRQKQQAGRYARVDGIPFAMPVNSEDSPALMAGFTCDGDAAQALLPGNELHAVRSGQWKLRAKNNFFNENIYRKDAPKDLEMPEGLYDLRVDPGEQKSVLKDHPNIVKRLREMMMHTNPAGAAAALRGMAEREDQTERLSQVNVPTLIVVGKEDPITPVADSEKMHDGIAGSQLVVIENASHVSNIEQPEQFNRALQEFLSR